MKLIQDGERSVLGSGPDDADVSDSTSLTFADLVVATWALITKFVKGSRRRSRYTVVTVIVFAAAGVLGYSLGDEVQSTPGQNILSAPPSSTASPSAGSAAMTRMVRVGGVGLQSYCQSFRFGAFDDSSVQVVCRSDIDLVSACIREHPTATKFALRDPSNLKTGSCYDRHGAVLGDIKDMSGYCRDQHRVGGSKDENPVHAEDIVNQGWQCRMPADVSAACAGQYNDKDLVAKYQAPEWGCYKPE